MEVRCKNSENKNSERTQIGRNKVAPRTAPVSSPDVIHSTNQPGLGVNVDSFGPTKNCSFQQHPDAPSAAQATRMFPAHVPWRPVELDSLCQCVFKANPEQASPAQRWSPRPLRRLLLDPTPECNEQQAELAVELNPRSIRNGWEVPLQCIRVRSCLFCKMSVHHVLRMD